MNKKVIIITILFTAIGAALGTFLVRLITGSNSSLSYDQVLVQVANETNKSLPMMIDRETRLDATVAGPGKRFTYSYTLVHLTRNDLDLSAFRTTMQPRLVANYKTHVDMKGFRDENVELHYQYKDKDSNFLIDIVVSPKDF